MSDPTGAPTDSPPEAPPTTPTTSPPSGEPRPVRHLTRSTSHRVLGGVCGGVAERVDMDPVVVRVIFVVLALLWGFGVLVYLAMWVVVPGDGAAAGAPPAEAGHAGWWLRVALPLGVLVAAAVAVLAFVGHSGVRPARGLGLFWVLCLVALAVVALRSPSRRLTLRRFVALVFLAFVSLVTLAVTAFLVTLSVIGVPVEGGSGVHTYTPIAIGQIPVAYRGAYGETRVDLTQVPFGAGTYHLRASQAVGQLIVEVPTDVRVVVTSHVGIGQSSGPGYGPRSVHPALTSGPVATLVLDLSVGIGRIEVDQVPVPARTGTATTTTSIPAKG
ncbi:MAG TPA: PspC domain-containing protein [Acidimicrobiales bacterium]|nr:PspC domain-containing protein [Acidimicrobiales bacterium]